MNDLKIHTWVATFKGDPCSYRLIEYTLEWAKVRKTDYCPVCNKKLKVGNEFYLTINNCKLFPNCLVHADCISKVDSVGLKWMDFSRITELLFEHYRQSIDLRKDYDVRYRVWRNKL